MRTSRAPWWLYAIAASFLYTFTLQIYNFIRGPAALGFDLNYSTGSAIVKKLSPEGAAAQVGLRTGDRIVAVNGIPIRGEDKDFDLDYRAATNFAPGQPILIEVERQGKPLALTVRLERKSPSDVKWQDWQALGVAVFPFVLALVIVFRRPQDPTALIGAWLLASMAIDLIFVSSGWASIWRRQPGVLGLFVWPASISRSLISGITVTFAIFFPQNLVRKRVVWILIWLPVVLGATLQNLAYWRLVYRPEEVTTALGLVDLYTVHRIMAALGVCYVLSTVPLFAIQYHRLMDINEKRRMHVFFAGAIVCSLAATTMIFFVDIRVSPPVYGVLSALYAVGPLALAYAVLRHRVFDLGVILRRGLQYALARRLLASAVPMLAAFFIIDLLMHRDQSILAVFRARGWMYMALSGLATVAFIKRQNWLDALDRRFFRERYDGRRLLREVVEEMRAASSFVEEAPRVATRIEAALHPEFVAFLACQPSETSYHTLSVVPSRAAPLALKKESKLSSLIRLLRKPLEIPQTESGWLQQQLPYEETEFLRQGRIDLLVPVTTDPHCTEMFMVLGAKRSEEPYSSEDQDLLMAIATSMAILLERPTPASMPHPDIFEVCPQCGLCYDSGSNKCTKEGARLVPVILPRLIEGRYHLECRLGRGGMGTVYAASDVLLERQVALKVIREDLVGSAEAADRFRREARTAASFAHPNVVTVHDFGVASGHRAFLVMEMLEGLTLRERLRSQKSVPMAHLLGITRDVCAALSAAHRRHLVHRDLKPENIFLVATELGEVVKVLDFGIAKFVSDCTEQTVDTAAGVVLGTPRYMSPEQRSGQAAHHAWDLWALAVVTYEMLTGFHPFEGDLSDWLKDGSVVPFTPVAKYMPQASTRWQLLFEHSFALELSHRHCSAEAFLSELQSAVS